MVENGMAPMQAIQSATNLAADALGKAGQFGCIAEGCVADIVAAKGDPLTDITLLKKISFVMKDGRVNLSE